MRERAVGAVFAAAVAVLLCALLDAGFEVPARAFWIAAGAAGILGALVQGRPPQRRDDLGRSP